MDDIELQTKKLLEENWSVEKDNMVFHRNMRRVEGGIQQPNIIICEQTEVDGWNKDGMAECLALVVVRTRIPTKGTTNKDVEDAKELKWKMREEVYRILQEVFSAKIAKPSGWIWSVVTRRQNGDNFDASPPLLGEDLNVTICYERREGV